MQWFLLFNDAAATCIYTLSLHDALPISMRDIKSKNVYSRVNSKATTQWRKTESANGVHLEGVASDNRSRHRSEERFSRNAETDLVCRLLLEKKNSARAWWGRSAWRSCAT